MSRKKGLYSSTHFRYSPGSAAGSAAENPPAQAVVAARQHDEAEQPVDRPVRQDVVEQLATVHEPVHQPGTVENGPRHDHPVHEVRTLDVDFLQDDAADAERHEVRPLNAEVITTARMSSDTMSKSYSGNSGRMSLLKPWSRRSISSNR